MQDPIIPISAQSRFQFACSKRLPCFNACCRNLNQFLTPYDILRLKNHLGLTSTEFLVQYTSQHVGPETGLPVVTLRPADTEDKMCPFVSEVGCRVYPDRPASCRIYPLARAVTRCRETGSLIEHFALLREPHCLGFRENKRQTVSEWIENQDLLPYNALNDLFLEIIALKRRSGPGPLDYRTRYIFQLALYDIDRFKDHIFSKGLIDDLALAPKQLELLKKDEIALLQFAHEWVKTAIFGNHEPAAK